MDIKYLKILCLALLSTLSHGLFELEMIRDNENNWQPSITNRTNRSTRSQLTKTSFIEESPEFSALQKIKPNPTYNAKNIKKKITHSKDEFNKKAKSQELLRLAKNNATPEQIEKILDQGADINFKDKEGKTALHWAATYAHFKVVETLIYQGADIHAQDYTGSTPLHAVSKHLTPRPKEREKIIKLLFQFGASIYDKDFQDRDVLEISDGHALQRYLFRTSLKYYGKKLKPAELQKEI